MTAPDCSVLIPSYRRPAHLASALSSLSAQATPPGEVLVVWQGDDSPTRDAAEACRPRLGARLRVLHSPEAGVVVAENLALDASAGPIVLLMDDDVTAPPDWISRHLAHYADPAVGAVGGPAINILEDGSRLPERLAEPVGVLTWYGRALGNMHDHVPGWRSRPPRDVDHLVGYNLSLRRSAFGRFEAGLRRYWQMFEMDACLQVRARGYRVLFDFANVVEHRPSNATYSHGRGGDLATKVDNSAYNQGFVLGKHSAGPLRAARLAYLLGVGSISVPGLAAFPLGVLRHGRPARELSLLARAIRNHLDGWRAGTEARRSPSR